MRRRLIHTAGLLLDILRYWSLRAGRIGAHLIHWRSYAVRPIQYGIRMGGPARGLLWLSELVLLLLDLLGLPEWYEMVASWLKYGSRPLREEELQLARTIFGDGLPYHRILLDEAALLGPRQYRFCYVSFCLINSWGPMPAPIFIHELVHVWQYARYGSPYLLRALLAQRTLAGYDYGGLEKLQWAKSNDLGLDAFNYEQQAAIVEDFFRLQQGGAPRWAGDHASSYLPVFRYFVDRLQGASSEA